MERPPDPDLPSRTDAHTDETSFICPRCRQTVTARFYGPCDTCRTDLRALLGVEAHDVEVDEYVPKMNVTPNAVAFREDD